MGTALIDRIENHSSLRSVYVLGWPHDTLAPVKVNAQHLAEMIERLLGASGLPIVFVCHSRGGLVARAAAVALLQPTRAGSIGSKELSPSEHPTKAPNWPSLVMNYSVSFCC